VERPILDRFTEAFAARIAALKVGPGLDPTTEIGPLMHARAVEKVAAQVIDAQARGARVITGGAIHPELPLAYLPTLLSDVPEDALIAQEETFGPVAAIMPFEGEAEVITRANASEYGLVA